MLLKTISAWEFQGAKFLLRNLIAARRLDGFKKTKINGYTYSGAEPADLPALSYLHKDLRERRSINVWRKTLFLLAGKKFLAIVKDDNGYLVGFQMFYFRDNEMDSMILHEAFIGVRSDYRGQSIATNLTKYSTLHFSETPIKKISSRVADNNVASLRRALAGGFDIQEYNSSLKMFFLIKKL